MARIAIVGSRTFHDYDVLCKTMRSLWYPVLLIVSGGAAGADALAVRYATENNIKLKIFQPDWDTFGKRAGPICNAEIVRNCDSVIAFWDGTSRGTASTIQIAKEAGKAVKIVKFESDTERK